MANQARVKSVLSGDTVILTHPNNPRVERTLSIAFVSAPRLRRDGGDEPFAFDSRDFLRKLLVGKIVTFRVIYRVPTSNREYGVLSIGQAQQDATPVAEYALQEGWVKLREDAGKKEDNPDTVSMLDKFRALEAAAKAEEKGVWAPSKNGKIDCAYDLGDAKSFAEEWKGKEVDGVVERVITGDRLIARLLLSPTSHVQTLLLLAGLRAPTTKRTLPDGQEQPGEPFAEEAQQFIETRLLQRNVKITPLGVSPQNQLIAIVSHPQKGTSPL